MDLTQMLLNLIIPPIAMAFLSVALPPIALMKFCGWLYHLIFSENVRGKVVLITGASSGIGEQMAYEYAKRGANLVLVARREERLRSIAYKSRTLGATSVHAVAADVSKDEDCEKFVDETINQYGHLDHLVNNAGVTQSFLFEEADDPAAFQPVVDVTFWGNVYPTHYALPQLKRSSGKIVVTASVAGWLPMPRMSLYNAAKAAVINFYDTLRIEVGPSIGITVATPGWIESEMTRGKFVERETREQVNDDERDVQVGPFPIAYAEDCAKAIVGGACRGQRYVSIPKWYNVFFLYRVLAPELLEWAYYLLFVRKTQAYAAHHHQQPLSKTMVDAAGVKRVLYVSSVQSSGQIKSD